VCSNSHLLTWQVSAQPVIINVALLPSEKHFSYSLASQWHITLNYLQLDICNTVKLYSPLQCTVTLKPSEGHSRSLEMMPFDRLYRTSEQCSTVTMALSCTNFDIFDIKNTATLKSRSGLLKVIAES